MWSPSKFIKMNHQYPGSGVWDSSVADADPGFSAFFALLTVPITVMAWSFGYEYVVAKKVHQDVSPVLPIPDPEFQGCGSRSGIRRLLRPSHHRDGLELWLRVCGRQVSSSSCITSVADPGSGIRIPVLRIRIRDSVPSLPFSSP